MTRRSYSATAVPTTLVVAIGTADTSLVIADATGWPDGTAGPFTFTAKRGVSGEEKILAATRSGTTLSGLTRGYEGTTAAAHAAGEAIEHTLSKTDLDEANAHVNATTGVHGVAGAVVGTTDAQTLTNKILTGPVADAIAATGLTGSVQPTRFVGGTVSGAPTTGAHLLGDFVIDQTGLTFICTVAGTPGTWVQGGSAAYLARANNLSDLANAATARANLGADAAYLLRSEAQYATVAAGETTTSTSYTDLATVGPTVTTNITGGTNKALVLMGGNISNNTATNFMGMSIAVSGATTLAASDTNIVAQTTAVVNIPAGDFLGGFILSGLNQGSNTFTVKYRVGGGTGSFARRRLIVIPL